MIMDERLPQREAIQPQQGDAAKPAADVLVCEEQQNRFWRAAAVVLPSWVLPSRFTESSSSATEGLFLEKLALDKMALGALREDALSAAKAEAAAIAKADAEAEEMWRTFLADLAALSTEAPSVQGESSVPPDEEERQKAHQKGSQDDAPVPPDEEALEEDASQILARVLAVDGDLLGLLFLHFCSFSWHSGKLVEAKLRLPSWRLAMESLETNWVDQCEPRLALGISTSQVAAAFLHASPPWRRFCSSPRSSPSPSQQWMIPTSLLVLLLQ